MVRNDIGPVAAFKLCGVVDRLPKTRSGKILRGTLRCIADKADWTMPATIEDASALDEVTHALETLGYAWSGDRKRLLQYNTACESDDVADLLAGPGVENERLANWLVATL